jgi:hypothetical protein
VSRAAARVRFWVTGSLKADVSDLGNCAARRVGHARRSPTVRGCRPVHVRYSPMPGTNAGSAAPVSGKRLVQEVYCRRAGEAVCLAADAMVGEFERALATVTRGPITAGRRVRARAVGG